MRCWHNATLFTLRILLVLSLVIEPAGANAAGPQFADVTAKAGITFRNRNSATPNKYLIETMTGGVALLDYDVDGHLDVFLTNGAKLKNPQPDNESPDKSAPEFWNRLYRNKGDGSFEDVTAKAGVRGTGYSMGVAVADYDNDDDPDLLVTMFGGVQLYRNNGDNTFTDVTEVSGLKTAAGWFTSAGFFDYDRDGRLDLFLCRYLKWTFSQNVFCGSREAAGRAYCHPDNFKPISNLLYRGKSDNTFTDVTKASGIGQAEGKGLGVAFADFDRDGNIDISVANDSYPQFLFHNTGNSTFDEIATFAGVAYDEDGKTFAGMGTDAADLDGDGGPDIVTTTLSNETYAHFRNAEDGTFMYETQRSGLAHITRLFAGWGVRAFDYDLDGAKDLFFANSHVLDNIRMSQPHVAYEQPPLLLRGGGPTFVDVSAASGEAFKRAFAARGLAAGDLDNDGDLDVVMAQCDGPAIYLRNEGGNSNSWIGVRLRGKSNNRDGIGARVEVTAGNGRVQHYTVSTAGSYQSAQDPRLYVGLGQNTSVKQIRVIWPNGLNQVVLSPALRKLITIEEKLQH